MKNSLFLLFFVAIVASAQPPVVKFNDPNLKNRVEFQITGNPDSPHYVRPLLLKATNISAVPITFQIDNGMMLNPEDDGFQPIVITREELIALKPGQKVVTELYGMCTEASLMAPLDEIVYHPGGMADTGLVKLTSRIGKDSLHNIEAQFAVWGIADDMPIDDIAGFDTTLVNDLVEIVAEVTGQMIPEPPAEDDYRRNYYSRNFSRKMGGEFKCTYYDTRSVSIAMFNKDGVVVRELYNNPQMPPGHHVLEFEFDATHFNDEYYFIRVIDDGEVSINMKIETLGTPGGRG